MYELFIIFILTLTTIIFATLFIIYYNNIDKYMKDKENELIKRESEMEKKKEIIMKYEKCEKDFNIASDKLNKITNIINS